MFVFTSVLKTVLVSKHVVVVARRRILLHKCEIYGRLNVENEEKKCSTLPWFGGFSEELHFSYVETHGIELFLYNLIAYLSPRKEYFSKISGVAQHKACKFMIDEQNFLFFLRITFFGELPPKEYFRDVLKGTSSSKQPLDWGHTSPFTIRL